MYFKFKKMILQISFFILSKLVKKSAFCIDKIIGLCDTIILSKYGSAYHPTICSLVDKNDVRSEKMEKKSRKNIIIGVTVLLLVTLTLIGLAYAYYRTRIVGNSADKSVSVTSKILEVKYSDTTPTVTATNVEPGYTYDKTFTVTNTSDGTGYYSIIIDNVANGFARKGDWTYTLKEGETTLKSGVLPQTTSYIDYSEELAAGSSKNYTLTITYVKTSDDQSIDMEKSLSFRVNIGDEAGSAFKSATTGTLLAAIGNDNIISEPLTVPGREVSTVSLYSEGKLSGTTSNMSISNTYISRYWVYGTGYEFNPTTGKYTLTGVKTGVYSDIYNELNGMYLISTSASSNSATSASSAAGKTVSNLSQIYRVATTSATALTYQTKKAAVALNGEAVFASTEGVNGDTYYFRGSVENNYVTYSGMCWRIVRVMENGDIKITLADRDNACGTANGYSADDTDGAFVADPTSQYFAYKYSAAYDATDFVYKNSDVAAVLKAWAGTAADRTYTYYDTENYSATTGTFTNEALDTTKLSATPNWCIDTSEHSNDGEGYIEYGAYGRLATVSSAQPSLNCASSLENESQIGILSADEVAFAGSTYYQSGVTYNYYLKTNATANWYWSLSPCYLDYGIPYVWRVETTGYFLQLLR